MDTLSEANGTFALSLLKKLGEDNSKNVFFSPMSISSALSMVFMGAKGNTAAQMSQVRPRSHFWATVNAVSQLSWSSLSPPGFAPDTSLCWCCGMWTEWPGDTLVLSERAPCSGAWDLLGRKWCVPFRRMSEVTSPDYALYTSLSL